MSGIIAAAGITAAAGLAGGLMNSKGSGGTQTQTSQTQLPGWITTDAQNNLSLGNDTARDLMGPYMGQRVADMTPGMKSNIDALQANVGSTQPWYTQALNQTNGLMGFNPSQITPQTLAGTNLQPYMNPYTQSVIDPSMQLLNQQNQQGLNSIGNNAIGAKAFGGSRQGVAEGAQNAQSNLLAGQLGAQLWGQNFNQAQTAATGDIQRNMTAQQNNQAAGEWGAGFRGQMANQLGSLATSGQNAFLSGINAAQGGQQQLYAQQQAQLDAAQKLYAEQRQQPIDVLNIRQNALAQAGAFGGQTNIQQGPGPSSNPLLAGLGAASTAAGLYGTLSGMNNNSYNGQNWMAQNPTAWQAQPPQTYTS